MDDVIFSPFKLKNYVLKNRIGFAPITRQSSSTSSIPRQDVMDLLVRRAKNGAAIVYTEGMVTDYESAQGYPGISRMTTQPQIDAWRPVVKAIQEEGALAVIQIYHAGRVASTEVNPAKRVIAPSAIPPDNPNPLTGKPFPVPEAMSKFDIDHVITGFVETAKGAVEAGFDCIEVHGAHGYLISEFLASRTNQRQDEYGGPIANRFRFAREVIQAVRNVVPDDRLLTFRISNWGMPDMEVTLFSKEEFQEIISLLANEPVDAVSISMYDYSEKVFETDRNMAQLAKEVTDLPLIVCGQIYNRATAEDALKDADIILSGKSLLLNPNWVEDIRNGKELPIYSSEDADVAFTDEPLP